MGRIYDVLNSLETHNLVRSQSASRPKKYVAVEPDRARPTAGRQTGRIEREGRPVRGIVDELSTELDTVDPPIEEGFWTAAVGPDDRSNSSSSGWTPRNAESSWSPAELADVRHRQRRRYRHQAHRKGAVPRRRGVRPHVAGTRQHAPRERRPALRRHAFGPSEVLGSNDAQTRRHVQPHRRPRSVHRSGEPALAGRSVRHDRPQGPRVRRERQQPVLLAVGSRNRFTSERSTHPFRFVFERVRYSCDYSH